MSERKKSDKSKRDPVQIPQGTLSHAFFFPEKENGNGRVKWEVLENLLEQLPKSKAERAGCIIDTMMEELIELYPETKDKLPLISRIIKVQLIGIEHVWEDEQGNSNHIPIQKQRLSDELYEHIKEM